MKVFRDQKVALCHVKGHVCIYEEQRGPPVKGKSAKC